MLAERVFTGRRALVTGATGFLGRHLTDRLSAAGAEVHAVSRADRTGAPNGATWWRADLTDHSCVVALLDATRPHFVFHLSGAVTAAPDIEAVLPTFHSLVTSTVNLATAANDLGCGRMLLAGSLVEPASGDGASAPGSPYVAAKSCASTYGRLFQRLYGAPITIAHLGYTYGPGQSGHRLVPYVANALLQGESPRLTSGRLRVDWVYVDDVIDGLLVAAANDQAVGRSLDLGSGALVSVRDVVELMAGVAGTHVEPQFGVLPDRPCEQFRPADVSATHSLIGWRATTPLERGLRRTLEWYRARMTEHCEVGTS